jgi:hypothetical protein
MKGKDKIRRQEAGVRDLRKRFEEQQKKAHIKTQRKKEALAKSMALYRLWKCPDGGALRCRHCCVSLSIFGA